jgi:hypothetical protein
MFSILFIFSVACGILVFLRLTGCGAWLTKGLREDKIGAVIATCIFITLTIILFILLRNSLPTVLASFAETQMDPDENLLVGDTPQVIAGKIIYWLSILCVPILLGFLLCWVYRVVRWIVRKSLPSALRPKSQYGNYH